MSFIQALYPLARPLLHSLDPETAHDLTLKALKAVPSAAAPRFDPALQVECWGLPFPNPLGLAAGFDKNAQAPDAMLALGFALNQATRRPVCFG
jgi:dihydroorotate dehydrogenase